MTLKLTADPTFEAKVVIPLPGGSRSDPVGFTFKHMTMSQLKAFVAEVGEGKPDVEVVGAIVAGWDLADAFNSENVKTLLNNYAKAGEAIFSGWLALLTCQDFGSKEQP
jgi:tail assembly chaperone